MSLSYAYRKTGSQVSYKHRYNLSNPAPTDWAHVCVTFGDRSSDLQIETANDVQFYYNGALLTGGNDSVSTLTPNLDFFRAPVSPTSMWADNAGGTGWSVAVKNLGFYNTELSSGDVTTLYQGGDSYDARDGPAGLETYLTMSSSENGAITSEVGSVTLPLSANVTQETE